MAGCHTDDFDWDVPDSPTMCLSQAVKMVPGELLVVVGFESMGRTDPNQSGGQARDQYSLKRQQVCRRSPVTSSSVDGSRPSRASIEKVTRVERVALQQRLLKPLQADQLTRRIAHEIATGTPRKTLSRVCKRSRGPIHAEHGIATQRSRARSHEPTPG